MSNQDFGEPTLQGPYGKAFRMVKREGGEKAWEATIASWLVNRPGAHSLWSWWVMNIVHLRDLPGVRPALKRYPEAEYEFILMALDPDAKMPDPRDPKDLGRMPFLTPIDVIHQFHGVTDAQADQLSELCAKAIVLSGVSPDSDYRKLWTQLLNNTVQHMVLGGHPKQTV